MKKLLNIMLASAACCGFVACDDTSIGSSVADSVVEVVCDSTFNLTGSSLRNEVIQSRTYVHLLGKIDAANYGSLESDLVTQFVPARALSDISGPDKIDSVKLVMTFAAETGVIGDSIVPMGTTVYRLNKPLPSPIYSDFTPSGYYSTDDKLASKIYTATNVALPDSVKANYYTSDGYEYRSVSMDLPKSIAVDLYNLYQTDPGVFLNPSTFAQKFPGIYVTNSFGSGRVVSLYASDVKVYYRKTRENAADTAAVAGWLTCSGEVVSNSNLRLNVAQSIQNRIAAGEVIVQSPAGYDASIKFPTEEILAKYNSDSKAQKVVNSLTFSIPADTVSNDYGIDPPTNLLLIRRCDVAEFFNKSKLTDNETSFLATYNSTTKTYSFAGMRGFIQYLIDEKNGVVTADDSDFVLVPVTVTSETQSSSYYYYYSSSTTTITTKIAPLITPSIVRLKLDEAKIKFTFSKQSAY